VLPAQQRLALGPAFDALEQGAALVPAGCAGGERRIQMVMGFDEGRADQIAGGDALARCAVAHLRTGRTPPDRAAADGTMGTSLPAGQPGVDYGIKGGLHEVSLRPAASAGVISD